MKSLLDDTEKHSWKKTQKKNWLSENGENAKLQRGVYFKKIQLKYFG